MANLGPVFCKMSVSIWIRGKTFSFGTHFHFFGHKIWPFLGSLPVFRNQGSTGGKFRNQGSTEERTNFLMQG